jgi:hypothetical protein
MRVTLLGAVLLFATACGGSHGPDAATRRRAEAEGDSAFASVQARGEHAMGVDQHTSTHLFEPLPDGGRIALQRDVSDVTGTDRIRQHMERIATAFGAGDFSLPGFVHGREVPGTAVMAAKREAISYTVELLPRGAAVRLRSTDAAAVEAIHEFLTFQRADHHAAGHPGT